MTAFIGAASTAAARHASFYAVDVWSEPHIVNWVWFNTPVEFCYCPYTQARFRDWLKLRYRTLDALNAAWYRTFASWDDVEAPRFGTILSYTDFIDWKTFIGRQAAGGLEAQGGRVRSTRRAAGVESLGRARHHAQPAVGIRQPGRLVDVAGRRSLRHVDLSEACLGGDAVVARAARVGARRNPIRGARQRVVDRRVAGGTGCDGGPRRDACDRRGPAPLGVDGDLAWRAGDQLLRLVSHECRLRVERLRHD